MESAAFGRYRLLERIDVGGMAEVFKAKQLGAAGFERLVAIKRILPAIAADPEVISMFIDEAKLAVQLSHPNIAQIFDLGQEPESETYFIAMEYVDGHSLKTIWDRWCAEGRRLPLGAVCAVVSRVADALHHAHFAQDSEGKALGIIHRDVSPANIMIAFDGSVKVIDFGMAKAENRVSRTSTGVVKGKLAYLSPEQAQGKAVDRRSDIFSLGICTWELLTGKRAFKKEDDRETVLAIRRGQIDPPSRFAVVPDTLDAIVRKALSASLPERYRTALELRDEIEGFMKDAQIDFGPRNMMALMRSAFPERFASEAPDGAIALVRQKGNLGDVTPADPVTLDHDQPTEERPLTDTQEAELPPESAYDDGDTVPNIRLPED